MIEILKKHPFFADKSIDSCALLENQGYCNENYIVVARGKKYVVRKLLRDDIDRDFEWQVLGLVYEKSITAEPLLYDTVNGFMVFEYLKGEHRSNLEVKELKHLAQTLKKLHSISLSVNPIVLQTDTSHIDHYSKEYVLCHNDLNPKNIFFTDEVKFIDFEYAGVNDKYFDLACVCVEFGLDEEMQRKFLDTYFQGEDFSFEKLEAYKLIYIKVCDEWVETL